MATYVSNRNGGKTDEQGHYRFQTKVWLGNVLNGFAVHQNSPLARNVIVPSGDLKIDYGEYSFTAWNDADVTVSLTTADTTNPRIDRIIAYIDLAASLGSTNNPSVLKFIAVAGTPAGSPTKASDSAVNTAVGASSPWCELATVRVEANATTIPDSKITDSRIPVATFTNGGWVPAMESWAYASYDSANKTGVITVPTDATTKYGVGDRVRFTNNGSVQYGIITAVSATTLTVYFGTDYSLTNSAITLPSYSTVKAPLGFPLNPDKWTVTLTDTNSFNQSSPTLNTWYNLGSLSVSIPIGAWRVSYKVLGEIVKSVATGGAIYDAETTLSTGSNTESNSNFTDILGMEVQTNGSELVMKNCLGHSENIVVASATTHYLNARSVTTACTAIYFRGDLIPSLVKAVCAYL